MTTKLKIDQNVYAKSDSGTLIVHGNILLSLFLAICKFISFYADMTKKDSDNYNV